MRARAATANTATERNRGEQRRRQSRHAFKAAVAAFVMRMSVRDVMWSDAWE